MPENPNKLSQFWQELKRRKVVRVITVYAAAAFVILELVSIIVDPLTLPEWTLSFVIVLMCIGFIIAVILSWIYDIHPEEGVIKTEPASKESDEGKSISSNNWKIASYISFVVIIALIVLNIIPRSNRSTEKAILDKSIAVLPFRNDSPDKENEYFINGTMESILNNLCKIKDLKVIARTSVEQYREKPTHIAEIAEALNVSYILEGSGQKYGNQIRLTVQLIDAIHGGHIWSRQYDKEIEDIFSIQSEIAQLVANEIEVIVTPEVKQRIEKIPTQNMDAYHLYLQGRHSFSMVGGKEGLDRSIQLYHRALEIDPGYALAYSGLAASYSAYAYTQILPRREVMHLARDAAQKALEIDNTLGEAHAELAWTRIYDEFDWKKGEKGLRLAIELNPNYAVAHRNYSWLLTFVGQHEEAITEAQLSIDLDPLSQGFRGWLPRAYLYAGDYDRAIEEFRKVIENYPDYDSMRRMLSLAYLQKGMNHEALSEIAKVKTMDRMDGYIYGMTGETEKAKEVLNYFLDQSEKQFVPPTDFTVIYSGLGDSDKAIEYLEKAYEQHEGWLVLLQVEPMYDNLRADPRFQAILDKMNFPNQNI